MNIALVGYRGSGKTAVARALAEQLGWDWADADAVLEGRAGCSIRDFFARHDEVAFRDLESEVLRSLLQDDRRVLALGGGVVLRSENRRLLRNQIVVWLEASPEILHARIHNDPTTAARRPDLTVHGGLEEIRQLLAVRAPLYRECADFIVLSEFKTPAQIAAEIVSLVSPRLEPTNGDEPA